MLLEGPAHLIRPLTQDDVRCPAGTIVSESACRCAIETSVIDGRHNPESIEAFCLGDYLSCTTWRAEKRREWKHDTTALIDRDKALRSSIKERKAQAAARRELANELMTSDSIEGRKFRAHIASVLNGRSPIAR